MASSGVPPTVHSLAGCCRSAAEGRTPTGGVVGPGGGSMGGQALGHPKLQSGVFGSSRQPEDAVLLLVRAPQARLPLAPAHWTRWP